MPHSENESDASDSRLQIVIAEYLKDKQAGRAPNRSTLLAKHADLADELTAFFAEHDRKQRLAGDATLGPDFPAGSNAITLPPTGPGADASRLPPSAIGRSADVSSDSRCDPLDSSSAEVRYFGDYELQEEIARGGMGVVYKARQMSLNRIVALKMILAGQLAGDEEVKRFHVEAEAAAQLDHPGIVPIHEVGEHDGRQYFSMGFVEGGSLTDRLRNGPLPPHDAALYAAKIAEAVAYAHDKGVVHRDLKPSNVLLDSHSEPKVTDFGLAKRVEGDSGLTATGQILGTPSYMPPEQASGEAERIGPSSDVYAIGAVLYELLTGRPPFQAATPVDTLMQVLDTQPVPPRLLNRHVPRDLETICLKCLEKQPAQRYGTAHELSEDLHRFLEGETIQATSIHLLDRMTRALGRSRHEEHFQGWGFALMVLGGTIFFAHLAIFLLDQAGYGPLVGYWLPRSAMFIVLFIILYSFRPQSLLPTNSAERLVWVVWIGYLIALGTANIILYLNDNQNHLYAFSAVLSGFGFFILGGHVWGGCYLIGLSFFAAAPLMAIVESSASLMLGTLWGAALFTLGGRYWYLGR